MLSCGYILYLCVWPGLVIISLSLSIFIKCNKLVSWEGGELGSPSPSSVLYCSIITSGDGAVVVVVVVVVVGVVVVLAVFSVGSRRAECSHVSSYQSTVM